MTKISPVTIEKRKDRNKPGPKPKPDAEKVVKKTVSLQRKTFAYLSKRGKGVLSHGIEAVVAEKLSK